VSAQGVFGFMSKEGGVQTETVRLGTVRHLVFEPLENKVNFPFKVSFSNTSQSVILASTKKDGRNSFIRLLQEAQSLTCALELTYFGLHKMPVEAARMSVLTTLNLASNQLRQLPTLDMPLLETLIVDYNQLPSVPPTVYNDLSSLTYLSLVENPIVRLPTDLGAMPMLKEVNIRVHFALESPPNSVVAQKKHLRFLRVSLPAAAPTAPSPPPPFPVLTGHVSSFSPH
jgi:Leucine-rich repeat (LRR) protein